MTFFVFQKIIIFFFFQFKNSYFGFKYIISTIDKNNYSISYITKIDEINNYDIVLCSFVSFEDYYLFIKIMKQIKKKTKIIIGGSGILNIIPIYDYIDIAVFGRCDNNINNILSGYQYDNVWIKEDDPYLNKKYKIGQLEKYIEIEPDLRLDKFSEDSIGCKNKCFFCNYTFKYNFKELNNIDGYHSGYNTRETTFKNLKWSDNSRYMVCAIDAITEKKRYLINKPISNQDIINKILERDDFKNEKSIQIKLYNIYGYPFENNTKDFYKEIDDVLRYCDSRIKYKITFLLHNTHFVPMPLTPMENEFVNMIDFKKIDYSFSGNNIKLIKTYTSGNSNSSIRHTIINRLRMEDRERFLSIYSNIPKLKNTFGYYFDIQKDNPIKYIDRNISFWKNIYNKRKNLYKE